MAFYGSGEDPPVRNDPWAPLLIPLTAVMVTLLVVFFVLFNWTTVEGDSMEPGLHPEDRLLLTKTYRTPERGEIVVFRLKQQDGSYIDVVKRVIGLPGDTIRTVGDLAWVNDRPEPSGYVIQKGSSQREVGPLKVPAGELFVLGDNRPVSLDSRFIGPVPMAAVKGKAVAIYAPITRLRRL